jgi:hypothetical protein
MIAIKRNGLQRNNGKQWWAIFSCYGEPQDDFVALATAVHHRQ